jgi:hypothetical protein
MPLYSTSLATASALALALAVVAPASAQEGAITDAPTGSPAGREYSPYPEENFPNQVFFGDTHLHTSYSTDAGMIGNTLGPEEAYRFARGETVTSSTGLPARLQRPYDFLVVADHAESIGAAPAIARSDPIMLETDFGRQLVEFVKAGQPDKAYDLWLQAGAAQNNPLAGEQRLIKPAWEHIAETADQFNEPGRFTALIGYEWTSHPNGNNLHRVVILRDAADKAKQVIPISRDDTLDPEDLWQWMADYEQNTGGRVLAIPHNGNLSNGLMFDDVTLTDKRPLDRDYAERRARWEPLYEITQPKGTGEAHPSLSTNDEFADFEIWDNGSFGAEVKTPDMLPREYAREALKRGLAYEAKLGVNPFKFGMIGSTDIHTSLSTTQENNFFGKVVVLEPSADPVRFNEIISGRPGPTEAQQYARQTSAAGLAGVWARENTREALWDAMSRKEVFGTTGTRLRVRVFGGFDFSEADLDRSDFARHGYANGVPMGGDLKAAPEGKAPTFVIRAIRDVDGANLDRIQVVKGWLDANGETQEKVFDVAWSGDRQPGADGKLPAVGNTVDVEEATYTNAIGAAALQAFWTDPDFDPSLRAFYYIRVLEIPTPRWTTYDHKVFGVALPTDVPASIQERAYTSPIWYTPAG